MTPFKTLIYRKQDGLAWVTLNRPRALNALNTVMRDELFQVLAALRDDPQVLAAVFCGAGERAFSAGADITEFGTAPSRVIARQARWERDLWGLFLGLDKPLLAAIHGYALGAGCELALACDLRLASPDARFGLPEVRLGMIPAAGGSHTMPRLLGPGRAAQLILTGEMISAEEALRIGLIHRVVPRPQLLSAAEALARKVMSRAPLALRYAKEAVRRGLELPLDEGLKLEGLLAARLRKTQDALLGVLAYREGRAPRFVGR
ncbi:MAG: enoyl-CoA hydratase-related protein [Chloroflexota bacterium]|nr:enoyl-CoA hydratase-related protein [Chloroflexota bacterium]